jgi:TfoX/Sxy family transcriptional regulator of competence genes
MEFPKASDRMKEFFDAVAPEGPGVTKRKMFGFPVAFANDNMLLGLFGDEFFIRLPEADRADLIAAGGKQLEPTPGRVMKEYVVVPARILENASLLNEWIKKSLDYTLSLPPKVKKPRKK